jgi:lipopolysaccharide transport system permease protein
LETRIYQKESQLNLFRLLKASLKDIYTSRFLSKQLAVRDIKALYRQSYLGVLWAFITPILTSLVWIMLRQSGAVQLSDTQIPYPVFVFSGTLLWSILVEAINSPIQSTNASKSILTKINFPKEALIVSGIYKMLFNSFVKLLLLVIFIVFYQMSFNWQMLFFPLSLIGVVIVGTAVGLLITPLGLLYKDIGKIISFGMQFIMYITPVVYVIPSKGLLKTLMELNILTPLILVPRDLLTGVYPEYLGFYVAVLVLSVPLLFLGLIFYRFSIPIVVERVSG